MTQAVYERMANVASERLSHLEQNDGDKNIWLFASRRHEKALAEVMRLFHKMLIYSRRRLIASHFGVHRMAFYCRNGNMIIMLCKINNSYHFGNNIKYYLCFKAS